MGEHLYIMGRSYITISEVNIIYLFFFSIGTFPRKPSLGIFYFNGGCVLEKKTQQQQ